MPGELTYIAESPLDARLHRYEGEVSDALLMMEAEIVKATSAEDLLKISRRAAALRYHVEHVETAAGEKAARFGTR